MIYRVTIYAIFQARVSYWLPMSWLVEFNLFLLLFVDTSGKWLQKANISTLIFPHVYVESKLALIVCDLSTLGDILKI